MTPNEPSRKMRSRQVVGHAEPPADSSLAATQFGGLPRGFDLFRYCSNPCISPESFPGLIHDSFPGFSRIPITLVGRWYVFVRRRNRPPRATDSRLRLTHPNLRSETPLWHRPTCRNTRYESRADAQFVAQRVLSQNALSAATNRAIGSDKTCNFCPNACPRC